MNESKIVYQDRVLKITRLVPHESNKYKIEMTNGVVSWKWEEWARYEEEAIKIAMSKFSSLYGKDEG